MAKGLPKSLSRNQDLQAFIEGVRSILDIDIGVQQDSGSRWPDGRTVWREYYILASTGLGVAQNIPLDGTVAQLVEFLGGTANAAGDFVPLPSPSSDANTSIAITIASTGDTMLVQPGSAESINGGTLIVHYLEAT